MIDGGLRPIFRQHLRAGWHWQSVETGLIGGGVPDSNYCVGGREGWVEYKRASANAVGLRPAQVAWLDRRGRAGGRVTIAVRRVRRARARSAPCDELWLLEGAKAVRVAELGLAASDAVLLRCDGGPAHWDWEQVEVVLMR